MKKKLVFCHQVSGHNIEYIHHLYASALNDDEYEYIFAVPIEFKRRAEILKWEHSPNINFCYLNFNGIVEGRVLANAWKLSMLLKKVSLQFNVTEVILISIIFFLPFLPMILPSRIKVSGIIYKIYLYTWKESDWKRKIKNICTMTILVKSRIIKKLFILNDSGAAIYLNKLWHTNKFIYLTDPYMPVPVEKVRDMRLEYNIPQDKIIVVHPGSLSKSKGTLELLKMIAKSNKADLDRFCFIFSGVVSNDIRNEFDSYIENLSSKALIIVKDRFLPYEELASFIYTADKVVLPYKRTDCSSGIIAYCAQFKKNVYVPNKGLLVKLVKRFHVGTSVNSFDTIADIEKTNDLNCTYCEYHSIDLFAKILLCKQ